MRAPQTATETRTHQPDDSARAAFADRRAADRPPREAVFAACCAPNATSRPVPVRHREWPPFAKPPTIPAFLCVAKAAPHKETSTYRTEAAMGPDSKTR